MKEKILKRLLVVVIVVGVVVGATYGVTSKFIVKSQYPKIYTLVNDKISASAPIVINLPKGTERDRVEEKVIFDPEIPGSWVGANLADAVAFKPRGKLEIGKYYSVKLATANGEIKKDFYVDVDPEITDIFPENGSEVSEDSSITVVFNRPMVPLTTLGELEDDEIPIKISLPTPGRFKWISTRSLQFIPKDSLQPSSDYSVEVNSGFTSIDGLEVPARSHKFITRPLRLLSTSRGEQLYNTPIKFYFNQAVNIDRTEDMIIVTNTVDGKSVPFEAKFGTKSEYDRKAKKYNEVIDKSIIEVYPKKDKFGRASLWDFENSYSVSIAKAFPESGDIDYKGSMQSIVQVTNFIHSSSVISERTHLASAQLFDPRGHLRPLPLITSNTNPLRSNRIVPFGMELISLNI